MLMIIEQSARQATEIHPSNNRCTSGEARCCMPSISPTSSHSWLSSKERVREYLVEVDKVLGHPFKGNRNPKKEVPADSSYAKEIPQLYPINHTLLGISCDGS